uniref:Uncharacterized protein n=1 Tax=Glossina morsitans morsitans TaxID=37546 RepID=A0ABK9NGR9_GLOMM
MSCIASQTGANTYTYNAAWNYLQAILIMFLGFLSINAARKSFHKLSLASSRANPGITFQVRNGNIHSMMKASKSSKGSEL